MTDVMGSLSIVGIGPGAAAHTSPAALEAVGSADLVVGYTTYIKLVRPLIEGKEVIRTGTTPVALVKSAYRKLEQKVLTDLDHFLEYEIGMLTTVIVGSSNTFVFEGYMITPRGYTNKYTWDGAALPGQTPGRSLVIPE